MSTARWADAVIAAHLFAIDPVGLGGVLLRSRAGPVRERWMDALRNALHGSVHLHHLPAHAGEARLLGGLDLSATLHAGKPVAERGLLAEADGGVLVVAMAERISGSATAHIASAMDEGATRIERDGLSLTMSARFGVVALDEGLEDEAAPSSLADRLAFHLSLDEMGVRDAEQMDSDQVGVADAAARLASVRISDDLIEAICAAAAALGIFSLRAPLLAVKAAQAHAAFDGRNAVERDDIAIAARLVLAPRATILPPMQDDAPPEQPPPPEQDSGDSNDDEQQSPDLDRALDEVILAAAKAAIPPGLLAALQAGRGPRARARSSGKSGALQKSKQRGRPAGSLRGELRSGAKLNLIETLRAAAPWQTLRRKQLPANADTPRVLIQKDDFRLTRFKQRTESTTIFVVDASGSAALHRLAEAKGAVELLLADCYIRRDQVALIAFRGEGAEILLPPTRSLVRAKRSLAGLPGGGGTPLASGLEAAFALADSIRRKGQTPTVIVMTDGRANIARDGAPGRPKAEKDATAAAKMLRGATIASIVVDTSPRPGPAAEQLSQAMGARYLPLPHADAATLSKAVKAAVA